MTTPSGQISLNDVNVELGLAGTTTISMNQTNVRTLAGVPSGAISMQNLQGKSNRVTASATISSDTTNYVLNTAKASGYVAGVTDMTLTINSGVFVYSTSTGSYALSVDTSWAAGDTVTIINNGTILGKGGKGGNGSVIYNPGKGDEILTYQTAGFAAGPGMLIQRATSINNVGRISGGGGGGGAGSVGLRELGTGAGAAGGGGIGNGEAGNTAYKTENGATFGGAATAGTLTAVGLKAPTTSWYPGGKGPVGWTSNSPYAVPGGDGGSYGSAGIAGYANNSQTPGSGTYAGGAGGACLSGNSNISWIATGTRNGAIT